MQRCAQQKLTLLSLISVTFSKKVTETVIYSLCHCFSERYKPKTCHLFFVLQAYNFFRMIIQDIVPRLGGDPLVK